MIQKIIKGLIVVFLVTSIISCSKRSEDEQAKKIYNESMKIHDEIMPRMDEMFTLENKLKALRDTLLMDSTGNAQKIAIIKERLLSLESTGKSMMDWMHNIKDVPGDKVPVGHEHHAEQPSHGKMPESKPEEILKIQQEQKSKIELIKSAMEKSIDGAKEIL